MKESIGVGVGGGGGDGTKIMSSLHIFDQKPEKTNNHVIVTFTIY